MLVLVAPRHLILITFHNRSWLTTRSISLNCNLISGIYPGSSTHIEWFSGRSCIRSYWNKVGVNFDEGGSSIHIHTAFVVEVEGVIEVHYASLTSQGVQHGLFYLDDHPSRYQPRPKGLISVNRREPVFSVWL